jgi:hypothetical protein
MFHLIIGVSLQCAEAFQAALHGNTNKHFHGPQVWNNDRMRRLLAHRRHRLPLLLPLLLALLVAQAGAESHAYSHLQRGSQRDGLVPGARLCAECCLAAPLLSAVDPAAAPRLPRVAAGATRAVHPPQTYVAVFEPPGFRSRAPPESP